MDPVTAHVLIDRPREEVFDYLADIANHPEFSDHYLKEWRLTREESQGRGAGARYRQGGRFDRFGYYDLNLAELDAPFRIVAVGRGGKYNRIRTFHQWTLEPSSGGPTLAVKDIFDTAGVRTTYGSAIFREHVPEQSAAAVTAQRENPEAIERSKPPARMTNVIATAMTPAGAHCEKRLKMFVRVANPGLDAATTATRITKARTIPYVCKTAAP